jgi:hypothetical protein
MARTATKRRVITVRMTREEREHWQAIARSRKLNLSNMLREALRAFELQKKAG